MFGLFLGVAALFGHRCGIASFHLFIVLRYVWCGIRGISVRHRRRVLSGEMS